MNNVIKNISWRGLRLWQRNFDVYKATWKVNFIPPLLEPVLYLLAFGVGLGSLVHDVTYNGQTISYLKFIAPGLVATAIMNHGFFETTYASFVRMYFQKTYDAILSTPLMLEDVILGEIIWGATKALFAASIMLLITTLWGLISLKAALLIVPIAFLGGMAFASLGMCFTALVKNIEMFNFPVFLFITPMFLFSGVFFPIESLPQWAQYAAYTLPLTFLVSLLRNLTFGQIQAIQAAELLSLTVMSFVCTYASLVMMKKRILK
ncbi:MAG: ABC transporter permease [Candidatus Omnitrophica bacterium]|nr:ABC transporter permease [Candidatus Omnitrophota bacterium]